MIKPYVAKLKTVTYSVAADRRAPSDKIGSAQDAEPLLRAIYSEIGRPQVEVFIVVALNSRHQALGFDIVGQGTAGACLVHPREVFRAAIELSACAIIVAHNHPSGDPEPSDEDYVLTERLSESGDLLGIPMIDSIVIGDRSVRSIDRGERSTRLSRRHRP